MCVILWTWYTSCRHDYHIFQICPQGHQIEVVCPPPYDDERGPNKDAYCLICLRETPPDSDCGYVILNQFLWIFGSFSA
jgi:hypothetical protein